MEDIKRILVVAKFTRYCKKAVHHGISLARHYQAELHVLRQERINYPVDPCCHCYGSRDSGLGYHLPSGSL